MKFHWGFLQNSYSWVTHYLLSNLKSYIFRPWDPKAQRALYHEPMMQNVARVALIKALYIGKLSLPADVIQFS